MSDNSNLNSSNVVVYAGGYYNNQNRNYGLLYLNSNSVGNSNGNVGARILAFITGLPTGALSFWHDQSYRATWRKYRRMDTA